MAQEYQLDESEIRDISPFPINLYFKLRMFISVDSMDKSQWNKEQKDKHKNIKKDILRMIQSNQDFNFIDDLNKVFCIVPKDEL